MPINPEPIKKGSVLNGSSETKNIDNNASKIGKNNCDFFLSDPMYTFEDMVLDDDLYENIMDSIAIYNYRDLLFKEWNLGSVIKQPMNVCINLYGESGTGKTMAANAIAHYLCLKILKVNYADIESKYVGETSKNIVKLFDFAKKSNAIIFFDEADALLSKRVTDMNSATDVSVNQTRSVLLTILDSYSGIVLFATNFISNYDPAFMRRIPHHIKFDVPNEKLRYRLLKHYFTNTVPYDIDLGYIAKKYEGITGADIANSVLTCAIRMARKNEKVLNQIDYEKAILKILSSKSDNKKKNKLVSIEEKEVSEEYVRSQLHKGVDGI